MTIAVLNTLARSALEGKLPSWLVPRWFNGADEAFALASEAEIGWFDALDPEPLGEMVRRSDRLRWVTTIAAGVEHFPLGLMAERGVTLTNGAGLNAITIAEYAIMAMLSIAKGYREVIRAQDRREWLTEAPGKRTLAGSRALILGAGAIGGRIAALLGPFGVEVVTMRRHPRAGELGPDTWRDRLGEFDWVVVTIPATPDTHHLVGSAELAAMRRGAAILNVSRGALIDQAALVAALNRGHLGAAFLDVTDPEPLPPDNPLWTMPSVHLSMHLSGRSQDTQVTHGAARFLDNLARWRRGEPLLHTVDLARGY